MMVYSLTWLPAVLEAAGLKVAETDGWRTRGRAEMGAVRGVICHHTATPRDGNMPTLGMLIAGRSDLPGPLCHLGLGRDGTYYVIAAGRANHAGAGIWRGVTTGNTSFIGIEAENRGTAQDPWPAVQMDAYRRGVAALLRHVGTDASMVCGHKEYALPAGRKSDPLFDMPAFREGVAAILQGRAAIPAPIPAIDTRTSRPTLRRGATGPLVETIQRAVGVTADGSFGAGTEAAVRAFQRTHQAATPDFVPDGIVGPKTWAAIDAALAGGGRPAAGGAASVSVPETATIAPASDIPIADGPQARVTVANGHAIAPVGAGFAQVKGPGFVTSGTTTVKAWLADPRSQAATLSASVRNIVAAVSVNEGALEAVNSYDNAHLSFGIMQWTAGHGGDGELAALLQRIKTADPAVFADCFSRYGLDCAAAAGAPTGTLTIDDGALASDADKDQLRGPEWAYRFWRAGHAPAVRNAQLDHAGARVGRFSGIVVHGHRIGDWLTSEYGMALLLDQHVNRPSDVARVMEATLGGFLAHHGADPAQWRDADEVALIALYLTQRAATSMTDSSFRADKIKSAVDAGRLSSVRGSFKP